MNPASAENPTVEHDSATPGRTASRASQEPRSGAGDTGGESGRRAITAAPASGASVANAHTASYPPAASSTSPITGPTLSAVQIDSPNRPSVRPRPSSGAMSAVHVSPAVNTNPSPAPSTSRATTRPGQARGQEVEQSRERRQQRSDQHHDPPAAHVGQAPAERPADHGGEGECARHHPHRHVAAGQGTGDVARQHGHHHPQAQERQQRTGEQAREGHPLGSQPCGQRPGEAGAGPREDIAFHVRGRRRAHGRLPRAAASRGG